MVLFSISAYTLQTNADNGAILFTVIILCIILDIVILALISAEFLRKKAYDF